MNRRKRLSAASLALLLCICLLWAEPAEAFRSGSDLLSEAENDPFIHIDCFNRLIDSGDYEILPSCRQELPSYGWEDAYALLIHIGCNNSEDFCYLLFRIKDCDCVFLYEKGIASKTDRFASYLYVFDGGQLYELATGMEKLLYSPALNAFSFGDSCLYFYNPHVLLKTDSFALPEDLLEPECPDARGEIFISEEMETRVLDLKGGAHAP